MKAINPSALVRIKTAELGLNPEKYSLESAEGIACALRRAAAYLAPCSPTTLVRAVVSPLEGLVSNLDEKREAVEEILEAVIAHGDIAEHEDILGSTSSGRLLYAAPPSFVMRKSGTALVLGIAQDHKAPLPSDLEEKLEYVGCVRRLVAPEPFPLRKTLREFGLAELSADYWTKMPATTRSDRHVASANELLDRASTFNADVPGLSILDPGEPVQYYRGRWKELKKRSGRFVGRRKQAYGADLWCYVEVDQGVPRRLVDFPFGPTRHRACDHAWHLQMAIDSVRGHPQEYAIDEKEAGVSLLKFFSPLPQWAQRRLVGVGNPEASKGCLLSYSVPQEELEEERSFLASSLWLQERQSK
jgi:hypothetical protein